MYVIIFNLRLIFFLALQDVFISITEDSNKKEETKIKNESMGTSEAFQTLEETDSETFDQESIPKASNMALLYLSQLKALSFKAAETSKRRICFYAW